MKSRWASITTSRFKIETLIAVFIIISQTGCTSVIFRPNQVRYHYPREFGLNYRDIFLKTPDKVQIHGWFLFSKENAKGTVFFLHGNAQNISAHIHSVHWLPERGYNVFIIDYRGYGDSTGSPSVEGAIQDIATGFSWLIENSLVRDGPIYMLGQSLGASLGICFVGNNSKARERLSGVILDAGFSNFRTLARDKLSTIWFTWPLQYPLSFLFETKCNPEELISKLAPVPVLIMHSKQDKVVPFSHGKKLYKLAHQPKFFKEKSHGHISTFQSIKYQDVVLKFMEQFAKNW